MPETVRITVFWAVMVLFAVHLGLALAAAAIPAITSVVGLSKVKRLKIFTDKFGQQAATFALLGGLWLFCVLAAVLAAVLRALTVLVTASACRTTPPTSSTFPPSSRRSRTAIRRTLAPTT